MELVMGIEKNIPLSVVYSTFRILLALCLGILLSFIASFQWEMRFRFPTLNL